ncbi:hypothetical protein VI26_18535 [Chromobacterium sp. LK1]|nr:hypothetical protein VI26_18535 [Chromobacterium sp. LK1]
MDGTPFGKHFRKHAPLAATAEQVQHGTKHLIQVHSTGTCSLTRAFQKWSDHFKLFATDIAWVAFSHLYIFSHSALLRDFEQALRACSKSAALGEPLHGEYELKMLIDPM